jgi:hypothetical protein
MYAFKPSSLLAVAALFFSNQATAGHVIRRAGNPPLKLWQAISNHLEHSVTESPLDPWVSVDASGNPVATITPVLSTINGVATTISAAPASLTATATISSSDSQPKETSVTGGGSFQVCHNLDGDFAPLCKPANGTVVYVGETYYGRLD